MTTNARALSRLDFRFGNMVMPVSIYKATEGIGLSGQLFHDGCGGKIRQWKSCEQHPNTSDPATISGIKVAEQIIPLDREIKSRLLGGSQASIKVVGAYRLSGLATLMEDSKVVVCDYCDIKPERFLEAQFNDLLNKMKVKKKFLLITIPHGNLIRYGILLSSGRAMFLYYEEEVRRRQFEPTRQPVKSRLLDDMLAAQTPFPRLTARPILNRVEKWMASRVEEKTIVAYGKDHVNAQPGLRR